jgi:tetratricopeptide (TPR) repeat protein
MIAAKDRGKVVGVSVDFTGWGVRRDAGGHPVTDELGGDRLGEELSQDYNFTITDALWEGTADLQINCRLESGLYGYSINTFLYCYFRPFRLTEQTPLTMRLYTNDRTRGAQVTVFAEPFDGFEEKGSDWVAFSVIDEEGTRKCISALTSGEQLDFMLFKEKQFADDTQRKNAERFREMAAYFVLDQVVKLPLPPDKIFKEVYDESCQRIRSAADASVGSDTPSEPLLEQPSNSSVETQGDTFLDRQELEDAIESYSKAIKAEPTNDTLFFKRGIAWMNSYYNRGKNISHLRAAISDYSRAIELNPQYGEAFSQRASLWSTWGMIEKAIADYDRCIELNEQVADVYFCRGILWKESKKFEDAIRDLTKAVELRVENALFVRGETYREAGKIELALADLTQQLSIDPYAAGVYCERARTYRDADRLDDAIADYSSAIELQPFAENPATYAERGQCYMRAKQGERALRDFERAAQLEYDFSLLQIQLRSEGHYDGPIDGSMNNTLKATIRFLSL